MLKPLHDNVILKKEEVENKTASGIILTTRNKESAKYGGFVVAVGEDVKNKEAYQAGDKVVYKEYSGTKVTVDDEDYIVIADKDILAVLA